MTALKSNYQRASVKASLICAMFGVLAAALISSIPLALFAGVGLHQVILDPLLLRPIIVGVIVLFAAAISLGFVAGNLIYRYELQAYLTPIIGIALAWSCLIISAVSAVSLYFITSKDESRTFNDYFAWPAVFIIAVGLIPALLFGLVHSTLVRGDVTVDARQISPFGQL